MQADARRLEALAPPQEAERVREQDVATDASTVMRVEKLDFYYGAYRALKDVTLPIRARQVTALIGPSGSGKSTFLRTLNRMQDFVPGVRIEGKVLLHDEDIYAPDVDPTVVRTRVGMVFQRPNPFPMSIYDNVAFGPKMHARQKGSALKDLVERSLRKAALWDEVNDKLKQSAHALSGGQQQRLCIARAIAMEPEVLLMDEPASALDPISTLKIEELMRELAEQYTIVIVTHNMQQAARVSDHTAFFMVDDARAGFIVECGPTSRIFTNPVDKRTEDYVSGKFG